jgi:hypothetical protein
MNTDEITTKAAMPQQENHGREVVASGTTPDPTALGVVTDALKDTTKAITTKATDEGNTPQADQTVKPLAEMEQQQQDARTSLIAAGIDPTLYGPYIQALESIPLTQPVAAQLLTKFLNTAMENSVDPQMVVGIGVAVAMRAKSLAAADPKRINDVVDASMGTLAKYEQRLPGHGIFQIASDAAHGRPFMNYLTQIRLLLVPKGVEFGQSSDLVRALTALVTPNSPQVGGLLDEYANEKTKYRQQQIQLGTQFGMMYAAYETERDRFLQGILGTINQYMPSLIQNPLFKVYMKGLYAASGVSALNNLRKQMFGAPNNPLQQAVGGGAGSTPMKKAEAEPTRPRRFAQVNPAAQNPMADPQQQAGGGAYGVGGDLTGQMNGANKGNAPENFQNTVQQGQQALQFGQQQFGLSTLFNQKLDTFRKSFERVLGMSSVQSLAPSDGGNAENMMASSNFAGGTIAQVANQTMQIGVELAGYLEKYQALLQNQAQQGQQAVQQSMTAGAGQQGQQQPYAAQNVAAGNDAMLKDIYWLRVEVDEKLRTLKSVQVMAPATDYIRQQLPVIESLELDIQASGGKQSVSGAVGQLVGLCSEVAKQFVPIISVYANVAQAAQDQNTKGWATQQYKYAALYRKRWMVKALTYVRQMKESKWGAGVNSGLASISTGRVSASEGTPTRFASEAAFLREADKEIEDYLNGLYGDTDARGYGTLLEHVEDHETDTTPEVDPEAPGAEGEAAHLEKKLRHRRFR